MILMKAKIIILVCGNVLVPMEEEHPPPLSPLPTPPELLVSPQHCKHQEHISSVAKGPWDHLATPLLSQQHADGDAPTSPPTPAPAAARSAP